MKRYAKSLAAMAFALSLAGCGGDTTGKEADGKAAPAGGDTSYFYGARIIPGDGSPVLEDQSFIVTNGKITKIGPRKEVEPPKGSNRVELTGRTVTPAFINLAAQPGMNNGSQYGPKNYTRDSVTADLSRYAYYGVVAVLTSGTDSGNLAHSVSDEIREGKIKGARLLTAGRGLAPKGGGPSGLGDVPYQIASAADAKRAVGELSTDKAEVPQLAADYADHPGTVVLGGGDATAARVLAAIDGARLAHIAAHGTFRADSPLFSALQLDDGPLTVYDLERLRQAPRQIVLSSCDSGVAAPAGTDELLGLASALIPLGTTGIVASVVPVNDIAVIRLMTVLHHYLRTGVSLSEALQKARTGMQFDPIEAATSLSFLSLGTG